MNQKERLLHVLKALVFSYLVTALILVVLAVGVWKLDFSETLINIGLIVSYIVSALVGGMYLGKKMKERRFLWGILAGVCYIAVLFAATLITGGTQDFFSRNTMTTAFICILSGMLGGMIG